MHMFLEEWLVFSRYYTYTNIIDACTKNLSLAIQYYVIRRKCEQTLGLGLRYNSSNY